MSYIMSEAEYDVACLARGELNATLDMLAKAEAPLEVYHYVLFDNDMDLIAKQDNRDFYFAPQAGEGPTQYAMGGPDPQGRPTAYTQHDPLSRRGEQQAYQMARRGGAEPTRQSFGSPIYNVGGMEVRPGMAQRAKDVMGGLTKIPGAAIRGYQRMRGRGDANQAFYQSRQQNETMRNIRNMPEGPRKEAALARLEEHGMRPTLTMSPETGEVEEESSGADLASGAPLIGQQPGMQAPTEGAPPEPRSRERRRNQPLETPSLQTGPEPQPSPEVEPEVAGAVEDAADQAESPEEFLQYLQSMGLDKDPMFAPFMSRDTGGSLGRRKASLAGLYNFLNANKEAPLEQAIAHIKRGGKGFREGMLPTASGKAFTPKAQALFSAMRGGAAPPPAETPPPAPAPAPAAGDKPKPQKKTTAGKGGRTRVKGKRVKGKAFEAMSPADRQALIADENKNMTQRVRAYFIEQGMTGEEAYAATKEQMNALASEKAKAEGHKQGTDEYNAAFGKHRDEIGRQILSGAPAGGAPAGGAPAGGAPFKLNMGQDTAAAGDAPAGDAPQIGDSKFKLNMPSLGGTEKKTSFDNPIDLAWDALSFRKNHQ